MKYFRIFSGPLRRTEQVWYRHIEHCFL